MMLKDYLDKSSLKKSNLSHIAQIKRKFCYNAAIIIVITILDGIIYTILQKNKE